MYQCKAWGTGYWNNKVSVPGHAKYDIKAISHRLKTGEEMWEIKCLHLRSLNSRAFDDELDHLNATLHTVESRKTVVGTEWEDVYHFLILNPIVGTFAWSELVEKAFTDAEAGLTYMTSVHIWKALAHTEWRKDERKRWILEKEAELKDEWLTSMRREHGTDATLRDLQRIDRYGWCKKYPPPHIAERQFSQWYGRYIVCRFKYDLGRNFHLTVGDEKLMAREFGWTGKNYVPLAHDMSNIDIQLPPEKDRWGNDIDEVHR